MRAWFARLLSSCLDAFRNPVMAALVDGLPSLSDDDLTVDQDLVAVDLCYERLASELSCDDQDLVASDLSSFGGTSDSLSAAVVVPEKPASCLKKDAVIPRMPGWKLKGKAI